MKWDNLVGIEIAKKLASFSPPANHYFVLQVRESWGEGAWKRSHQKAVLQIFDYVILQALT